MTAAKKLLMLACTFAPSSVRLAVFRALGFKIGQGCRVSPLSVVIADDLELDHGATIEALTLIYAPSRFAMGERSRIASFVRIIGHGPIELARQAFIALGCLVDTTGGVFLGPRSCVGPRSMLYTHGSTDLIFPLGFAHRNGPIHVEDDVWVSMGCIIYPKVKIGARAVLSPGTIVSSNVPADRAVFPAKNMYTVMSNEIVKLGVDDAVKTEKIDEAMRKLHGLIGKGSLDESDASRWVLEIPGRGRVIWLRDPSAQAPAASWEDSVVFRLGESETRPSLPTFEFGGLRVVGGWTSFADWVAAVMCDGVGIHFVFTDRSPPS